jgi:hypothetical protein
VLVGTLLERPAELGAAADVVIEGPDELLELLRQL